MFNDSNKYKAHLEVLVSQQPMTIGLPPKEGKMQEEMNISSVQETQSEREQKKSCGLLCKVRENGLQLSQNQLAKKEDCAVSKAPIKVVCLSQRQAGSSRQ
jgi:hypothetical protein